MPERKNAMPAYACVGEKVNLWPAAPDLSYSDANSLGRERGSQLVDVMRRTESPALLGHVVEAIQKQGHFGGLEIGFFHALAQELITPVPIREFVEVGRREIPALRQVGHLRVVA